MSLSDLSFCSVGGPFSIQPDTQCYEVTIYWQFELFFVAFQNQLRHGLILNFVVFWQSLHQVPIGKVRYIDSLNFLLQCSGASGVCADENFGGSNQLELVNAWRMNGVSTIRYKRPLRGILLWQHIASPHVNQCINLHTQNKKFQLKFNLRKLLLTAVNFFSHITHRMLWGTCASYDDGRALELWTSLSS